MKQLYEKIEIKTADDLPKEKGFYFVHYKHPDERMHTQMSVVYYDESILGLWFGKDWYDWYLRPLKMEGFYEREFVEFCILNDVWGISSGIRYLAREKHIDMFFNSLDELYEYWQTNVKDK
jgi:hypothetical protein